MEKTWDGLLDMDDDDSCLVKDTCIEELLRDAPEGCVYCRLRDLEEGDDE